ncbi:MAG TPA: hypothetical protein VHT72_12465, partial [Puia sp.]|nr:hypothetical protein [Puia sp.]
MRKYGFILFSLVIIAIFFGAFFLYYVPYNKEAQNKYAFLVLKNIESNLQFRIQASIDLFSNNLQRSFNNDTLSAKALDTLKPKLTELRAAVIWRTFNAFRNYNVIKTTSGLPTGELYDISYDSIIYQMSQGKDSLRLFSPLSKMADDILRPHKNDFFQYFLFLKIKDSSARPVFQSDGLDLGTEIEVDSLLPGSKTGFYEGITDVPLGDADYKMFYIPVNINGRHFAICGFKNAGEYLSSLHQVPSKFIYPIVIALLLVLIILPLIKLYIMGPNESIRIWDFAGYFSALFIGSTFLTIVIIQVVLLKDSDIRSRRNLKKLSEQISKSFQKEISKAYDRLNSMDLVPLDDPTYDTTTFWPGARIDVSKTLNKWLKERPASDSTYYNFD